jgi:hypothetical protein
MKDKRLKYKMKKYIIILIAGLMLVAAGCSRTVTPLFPEGKTISLNIDFKDNIDGVNNNYYIIMRSAAAPNIPFTPIEFNEPDDTPSQPEIDYFGDYFSTWDYYFLLEGNTIYLASGPFVTSEAVTIEAIASWPGNKPKNLFITYDITRLYPTAVPNMLYFDVVTVDNENKTVKDNLSTVNSSLTSQYIDTTYAGTFVKGSDEETEGINMSLDIINWNVTID